VSDKHDEKKQRRKKGVVMRKIKQKSREPEPEDRTPEESAREYRKFITLQKLYNEKPKSLNRLAKEDAKRRQRDEFNERKATGRVVYEFPPGTEEYYLNTDMNDLDYEYDENAQEGEDSYQYMKYYFPNDLDYLKIFFSASRCCTLLRQWMRLR
jgi:hypothetical protein